MSHHFQKLILASQILLLLLEKKASPEEEGARHSGHNGRTLSQKAAALSLQLHQGYQTEVITAQYGPLKSDEMLGPFMSKIGRDPNLFGKPIIKFD